MDNEMKELFVDLSEKVYSDSYGLLLRQILSARRYEEVIRMGDEKPEPSFSELVNRLARMTYSLKESISQSGSMKIDHDIVRYALLFALLMWCDGEKIFNELPNRSRAAGYQLSVNNRNCLAMRFSSGLPWF